MLLKLNHKILKLSKLSVLLLGCLNLSSTSFAVEATANTTVEKKAQGLGPINAYSNLRLSHYMEGATESLTSDKIVTSPRVRFQPTLGAKLFNDEVNAYAVGYFDRMPNTPTLEQAKQTRLYLEFKGWQARGFAVEPYIRHDLAFKGSASRTQLASVQSFSHLFSTGFGALTPSAGVELGTYLYGKAPEAVYTVDQQADIERLGLRSSDDVIKGKKKNQDFYHEWFGELALAPNFTRGLSVALRAEINNSYAPSYHIDANQKEETSYPLTMGTTERLRVAYAINERFTVRNDYYAMQSGLFEKLHAPSEPSMINELQLIYTLF